MKLFTKFFIIICIIAAFCFSALICFGDVVPSKATQSQANAGIDDVHFMTPKVTQNKPVGTNGVRQQFFTGIDRTILTLTNAGTAGANGQYIFGGLYDASVFQYTNSSSFIVLSNGPASQLQLTNISDNLLYYHKAAVAGFINGNAWLVDNGIAPGPNARWTNSTTFGQNTQGVYIVPIPVYPGQYTNEIFVSNIGSDTQGLPGIFPFASIDAAIFYTTNYPKFISVRPGYYPSMTTNLPPFATLVGSGRSVTTLGSNFEQSVSVSLTLSNVLKDLKIEGKIQNGASAIVVTSVTNTLIDNCEIGTTNQIDCFFVLGASGSGFYGLTANNTHFVSAWDVTFGVNDFVFNNCLIDVYWGSPGLSASDTNSFTGTHGVQMGSLNALTTLWTGTINGGTINVANGINSTVANSSNACIMLFNTNISLTLNGPNLNHSAQSGVYHAAIYNPLNAWMINGFYYDNGILTFISNGTNIYQPSTFSTNTLPVTATGLTNNTIFGYLCSITAGTALSLKDINGNGILAPVLNNSFPLKPGWRLTGTAVTGIAIQQ